MKIEWKEIDENTPYDVDLLVKGGDLESEIPFDDTSYDIAHVRRSDAGGSGENEWQVQNWCYYEVWVENPTHYAVLEN